MPQNIPEFYKRILESWIALGGHFSAILDSLAFIDSPGNPIWVTNLSAKACYNTLLSNSATEPHCVAWFLPMYGPLNWPSTWSQLHAFPQDRPVIDLAWKVAHGVPYSAERLASIGYQVDLSCFCGAQPESLEHLFFYCPLAQSGLAFIEFLLYSAVPVAPTIICRHVLFGFSSDELLAVPPAFVYLLNLLKYYVYRSRNDFRFCNLPVSDIDLVICIKTHFRFNIFIYARCFKSGCSNYHLIDTACERPSSLRRTLSSCLRVLFVPSLTPKHVHRRPKSVCDVLSCYTLRNRHVALGKRKRSLRHGVFPGGHPSKY